VSGRGFRASFWRTKGRKGRHYARTGRWSGSRLTWGGKKNTFHFRSGIEKNLRGDSPCKKNRHGRGDIDGPPGMAYLRILGEGDWMKRKNLSDRNHLPKVRGQELWEGDNFQGNDDIGGGRARPISLLPVRFKLKALW